MRYPNINNKLFIENRKAYTKLLEKNAISIIFPNPQVGQNGDALYNYKCNSDLFWLTGIEQEKTILVLYPNHPDKNQREILFIIAPNPNLEKWEGHKLTKAEAQEISGVKNIQFVEGFDQAIMPLMHRAGKVFVNSDENDRRAADAFRTDLWGCAKMQKDYPLHEYGRASYLLRGLRQIKSKYEADLIQTATNITHKALNRIMSFIKPGVWEYELEAEMYHEFLMNRSRGPAYGSIFASGSNACILHYVDNNQQCKDGDLILMDFGAEYGGYVSDLSRTIPVNGKYSPRQKEVYDAVLAVHNFAKKQIKPGLKFSVYLDKVNAEMDKQLVKLGLLTKADIKNQDPQNPARRQYYYHGLGHHMGIDVHDIGWTDTMQEAMVLTVEPGIYIQEEGLGVRIENDIMITKSGIKDFFKGIPITTDEIESFMNGKK